MRRYSEGDQLAQRAACLQMYMGGLLPRVLTNPVLPGAVALAATAATERAAGLAAFVAAGTARDAGTSDTVGRCKLTL